MHIYPTRCNMMSVCLNLENTPKHHLFNEDFVKTFHGILGFKPIFLPQKKQPQNCLRLRFLQQSLNGKQTVLPKRTYIEFTISLEIWMNTCNGSHTTQMLDLDVVHSTVQCFLALSHDYLILNMEISDSYWT